jgi:hypothetical protein
VPATATAPRGRQSRQPHREALLAVHAVITWLTTAACAVSWLLVALTATGRATPNALYTPFAAAQLPAACGLWVGHWLIRQKTPSPRR